MENHWASAHGVLRTLGICGLVCVAGLMGCGPGQPQRHGVSGTVKFDGSIVSQGSIEFIPIGETKGPSAGSEIKGGAYSVPREKGLVAGRYRVEIHALRKTGKQIEVGSPAPPGTMADETEESLPARYNTKSEIEEEIPAPKDNIDFNLLKE